VGERSRSGFREHDIVTRTPSNRRRSFSAFRPVADAAVGLPGVVLGTRYDGSPVLRCDGRYLAGFAMHPSAEPNSLVVKADPAERQWLLEEAPDTYYLPEYFRPYPVVLVRLQQVDRDALRDLLRTACRVLRIGPAKAGHYD
jgi:hypothetical protein